MLHLIEPRVIEVHVFNANVCYIPTVYKQSASFYHITTCVCNIDHAVDIGKHHRKKNSVPPALVCVARANSSNSRSVGAPCLKIRFDILSLVMHRDKCDVIKDHFRINARHTQLEELFE